MVWKDFNSPYLNKVKKRYLGKVGDMDKFLSDWSSKKTAQRNHLIDRDNTWKKLKKCQALIYGRLKLVINWHKNMSQK